MIGEWNDCINNDIMTLKREIIDDMIDHGVDKFILLCENVLNYHASDDSYYQEWWEDTPGYKQHLSYARIRAIENRRSIARSANTGTSCFVNQKGDIIDAMMVEPAFMII